MREFLNITKALSDENRIRALLALASGELCVCQLIELLGLAPSTVSKHMAILHQAGLAEPRKDGRWIYYRLAEEPLAAPREDPGNSTAKPRSGESAIRLPQSAIQMTLNCLAKDQRIRQDAKRLKAIRKMSRDELCAHYHNHEGRNT